MIILKNDLKSIIKKYLLENVDIADIPTGEKEEQSAGEKEANVENPEIAKALGKKSKPPEFKRIFGPIMQKVTKGTPILPSVKLAQMALETGWGKHTIGNANNLFGIKASGNTNKYWDGSAVIAGTEEVVDNVRGKYKKAFRKYKSYKDSLEDHNNLLMTLPRYKAVRDAKTPEEQAHALKKGGYATGPRYAEVLISIIKDYGFKDLDPVTAPYTGTDKTDIESELTTV